MEEKTLRQQIVLAPRRAALFLVRLYQMAISPHLMPSCRFYPSCSEYAYQAIQRRGVLAGIVLAARRLSRCHPLGGGGYDPVPEAASRKCRGTCGERV